MFSFYFILFFILFYFSTSISVLLVIVIYFVFQTLLARFVNVDGFFFSFVRFINWPCITLHCKRLFYVGLRVVVSTKGEVFRYFFVLNGNLPLKIYNLFPREKPVLDRVVPPSLQISGYRFSSNSWVFTQDCHGNAFVIAALVSFK